MVRAGDVEMTKKAIIQRGLFVHRYSGIEFSMCELIMRAQTHPLYHDLGPMPFKFTNKIDWVRKMLDRDGPVKPYADDVRLMLRDFLPFEEIRHFMMHGLMGIAHDTLDGDVLRFTMYDHVDGKVSKGRLEIHPDVLTGVVADMGQISGAFPTLVDLICQEADLGEFPMDEPKQRGFRRPKL
jgi:hypothetical protein